MSKERCQNCGSKLKNGECTFCHAVVISDTNSELSANNNAVIKKTKRMSNFKQFLLAMLLILIIPVALILRISHLWNSFTENKSKNYKSPNNFVSNDTSEADKKNSEKDADDSFTKTELLSERGVWPMGMYEIGTDVPEGTYLLVSDTMDEHRLFVTSVYADAEKKVELTNDPWASYSRYVTLKKPGYLNTSWCTMYDYKKNDVENNPYDHPGMFLVGRDIKAGTYELEATNDYDIGYYIYSDPDPIAPVIKKSESYYDGITLKLNDGEFVMLKNCKIK